MKEGEREKSGGGGDGPDDDIGVRDLIMMMIV